MRGWLHRGNRLVHVVALVNLLVGEAEAVEDAHEGGHSIERRQQKHAKVGFCLVDQEGTNQFAAWQEDAHTWANSCRDSTVEVLKSSSMTQSDL